MNCNDYIENYLAAHIDGELNSAETIAVEQHLRGCDRCRLAHAEARAVKALVSERARRYETPKQVRGSILAALDAVDSASRSRERPSEIDRTGQVGRNGHPQRVGPPDARRTGFSILRRARVWVPTAVAAVAVFAFVIFHGGGVPPAGAVPAFDSAIARYENFNAHFVPNVPSASPADISDAYLGHNMPGMLWNLQPSGYRLVGGRLDRLSDGSLAAFTFYRGEGGSILCAFMKAHGMQMPDGATQTVAGHNYYVYKGYRICLSYYPRGGFISVLVSRNQMPYFVQDILGSSL
jgi:anti-sigma factor RsiW